MKNNRKICFMLLFSCCLLLAPLTASALAMNDAISIAGQQRMLSQRMVKAYALVGQHTMLSVSTVKQMDDTIRQFDRNLEQLVLFAETPKEKKVIGKISRLWFAYRVSAKQSALLHFFDRRVPG
ncbi:type IV pili methyl-accepting chemotaxis transducer N-terminal domain-containing protein [Thiolapillus sp.]|uniref:type IV pili methyl-accepting chemotaxis transducer N-terminal domain-containing protein n=1 Tax=Thiolapillus sp. TaxID=2017437 RepID=UPI0025E3D0EC|nr:type IV pili methyl-accepting chemotaxis transducer N-terminal domain-containing protein [Thiolapillus sp.]